LRRFALPCPGYRHGTPKPPALPTAPHPVVLFYFILLHLLTSCFQSVRFPQKHSRGSLDDRGTDSAKPFKFTVIFYLF